MEDVLDLYGEPYDARYPTVCFDEKSYQMVSEKRQPIAPAPGRPLRYDYEYKREGVRNLFVFFEPLSGWRHIAVTARRTKLDFAEQMRWLVEERYPKADGIGVVLDQLNTHKRSVLYEAFAPARARAIARKLEFHYTPKHGSWLNMAEIELSVLARQCLRPRIGSEAALLRDLSAYERRRNAAKTTVEWRFSVTKARDKLKRLYPSQSLCQRTSFDCAYLKGSLHDHRPLYYP